MRAVIMAGGEGVRLRPLTCSQPKPMSRLCGKPTIEYILDLLCRHGVENAEITLKYMPDEIISHFENGRYKNINLRFVIENTPMGTAGGVRNAVEDTEEDILIVSGDALTDFNLSEIIDSHRKSGAEATIVTSEVADPREFGLVVSDEKRFVSRFIEKPPYSQAVSREANTGIYIISPNVLKMIPKNEKYDFAGDLFPRMMSHSMPINVYKADGYWCDIGDIGTYISCQSDIMSDKVETELNRDNAKNGIMTGNNVRIAPDAVLSDCVIEDNCVIESGVKISGSVILKNSFISSGTHISGSLICENVKIGERCCILEQAVIGAGTVLGDEVTVKPSVRIWPEKNIYKKSIIRNNVKFGSCDTVLLDDNGFEGDFGSEITPQFCVRLGQSLAGMSKGRIVVAASSGAAEFCCKSAVIAGIMSAGGAALDLGNAILPLVAFAEDLCNSSIGVFIGKSEKLSIGVYSKNGVPFSRKEERQLESLMLRAETPAVGGKEVSYPSKINGIFEIYQNSLISFAPGGLEGLSVSVSGDDELSAEILSLALTKLGVIVGDEDGSIKIKTENFGKDISVRLSGGEELDSDRALALSLYKNLSSGASCAVRETAPLWFDSYAEILGGEIMRYNSSTTGGDDTARETAKNQMFTRDGLMTAVKLLHVIKNNGDSVSNILEMMPKKSIQNKFVAISASPSEIIGNLIESKHHSYIYSNEGIIENISRGAVRLIPSGSGRAIRIIAEAVNAETAAELTFEAEEAIRSALDGSDK
ncbi:MAG: NTP transferase domain-containing protein [Oscillospiraceae bacterium]|jgi:mannose-1-phosphate guanylyltransferase/phosphomannomutase|nr:NTP transferase domain-containing protein [Oscillospiraceae bacterium]